VRKEDRENSNWQNLSGTRKRSRHRNVAHGHASGEDARTFWSRENKSPGGKEGTRKKGETKRSDYQYEKKVNQKKKKKNFNRRKKENTRKKKHGEKTHVGVKGNHAGGLTGESARVSVCKRGTVKSVSWLVTLQEGPPTHSKVTQNKA